jgi:hypothetical protein
MDHIASVAIEIAAVLSIVDIQPLRISGGNITTIPIRRADESAKQ